MVLDYLSGCRWQRRYLCFAFGKIFEIQERLLGKKRIRILQRFSCCFWNTIKYFWLQRVTMPSKKALNRVPGSYKPWKKRSVIWIFRFRSLVTGSIPRPLYTGPASLRTGSGQWKAIRERVCRPQVSGRIGFAAGLPWEFRRQTIGQGKIVPGAV